MPGTIGRGETISRALRQTLLPSFFVIRDAASVIRHEASPSGLPISAAVDDNTPEGLALSHPTDRGPDSDENPTRCNSPLLSHKAASSHRERDPRHVDRALKKEDEINLETAFMHLTKGITS